MDLIDFAHKRGKPPEIALGGLSALCDDGCGDRI